MRRALTLLAVVAGCVTEPQMSIRVEGTVTEIPDGSLIAAATVSVHQAGGLLHSGEEVVRVSTDGLGHYSLSFATGYCNEFRYGVKASRILFRSFGSKRISCTEEIQTIDLQLERCPTIHPC